MPQLRHKHKGTRRKIGRKRFPNKSIKVEERAYKQVRQLEETLPAEVPTLSIVLDIGVEKVNELIRTVTKDNEDAFQDAWLAILEDHVASEDDVLRVAREVHHKHCTEVIAKEHTEVSLDEPIGMHRFDGDNSELFTFKSVIPADQPHELDQPTRVHHQSVSPRQIALDPDVKQALKQRFPNVSYRDAVRQLLGLPLAPKKNPLWQPWEDDIIRKVYAWGGTVAVHLELPHREENGIRGRAKKLGYRFDKLRPKAEWLTTAEVAKILGTHSTWVCRLARGGKLQPIPLKYQGGVQYRFRPDEITRFLRTQPWDYHAENVAKAYQEYIPASRKPWITIIDAARQVGCHRNTILRYKKQGILETKVASPYQLLVRIDDVVRIRKLAQVRRKINLQHRGHACKCCGSRNILKWGHRKTPGQSPRWICKDCGHTFALNGAAYKMRTPQFIIDKAIELRKANATHSKISKQIHALYGVRVPSATLSNWWRAYDIKPTVPDKHGRWRHNKGQLIEMLVTHFKQGTTYSLGDIFATCGYSIKTKPECTQLTKQNLIIRRNGGYIVNDRFYLKRQP